MNREIKFRGKRKLNGKWVYGSLIQIGNDWCQIIPVATEYDEIKSEMLRVISDTVGQFTGLQDNNKVDIYEGDICKDFFSNKENIGEVRIEPTRGTTVGGMAIWPHNIEIIGNIYEHPELIK